MIQCIKVLYSMYTCTIWPQVRMRKLNLDPRPRGCISPNLHGLSLDISARDRGSKSSLAPDLILCIDRDPLGRTAPNSYVEPTGRVFHDEDLEICNHAAECLD